MMGQNSSPQVKLEGGGGVYKGMKKDKSHEVYFQKTSVPPS